MRLFLPLLVVAGLTGCAVGANATGSIETRNQTSRHESQANPTVIAAKEQDNANVDSNHDNNNKDTKPRRNKVVVIGSGPGGMFFLHALATKRKQLIDKNDTDALDKFPEVTVYEQASSPGGVWRPHSSNATSATQSTDMMPGLWSNSPSFDQEFFDYTFQDHFGTTVPVYLPRKLLLQYMLARVTSVEDVFQCVQFNTRVVNVKYEDDTRKFVVRTKDLETGIKTANEFDKLVLASGLHTTPYYPESIQSMLSEGGFVGESLHSSEIVDFDESIKGKRIVLVGDSFSAEDLTLQALKMGAGKVYITSAKQEGTASLMSSWPGNEQVDSLKCLPTAVLHNGTGLLCSRAEWDDSIGGYAPVEGGKQVELDNIDAVIYCTGYKTQTRYLARELRYKCYDQWSPPKDWRSQPNSLTRDLGHIPPSSTVNSEYVCTDIYRHILIDNPNVLYIRPSTEYYLAEIDAIAWALASYVTGQAVLPSRKEMEMKNYLERIDELNVPDIRRYNDKEYKKAVQSLLDRGHWLNRSKANRKRYDKYFKEGVRHAVKLIARDQLVGGHGGGFGSYDKLSPRGELFVEQYSNEEWAREFENVKPAESEWRTFRDIDPSLFVSLYTGVRAAPLRGRWMELDDDGNPAHDANGFGETCECSDERTSQPICNGQVENHFMEIAPCH